MMSHSRRCFPWFVDGFRHTCALVMSPCFANSDEERNEQQTRMRSKTDRHRTRLCLQHHLSLSSSISDLISGEFPLQLSWPPSQVEHHVSGQPSQVRVILKGAEKAGCDACVLSAFGCGAFGNPPEVGA